MKFMNGLFKTLIASGASLFLTVALFNPLMAQIRIESTRTTPIATEDQESSKTSQITKVPIQLQLPASLAKAAHSKPIQKAVAPSAGLVTIMSEDFEGNFPSGSWVVNTGDYTWAKRNCVAHNGASSAWAVGGGTSGNVLACGANYPNSISTIMSYGPFDLSDANYAAFSFWLLLNSETNYDFFSFLASEDGTNFSGFRFSGTTNGAWFPYTQALTAVPAGNGTFKNLMGKSAVWIAFAFSSDGSSNNPTGALVDDIVLQKGIVNAPTLASSFSSPGPSPRGLAFDGTNLFCSDATNDRIYKLTTTGGTISSYVSPGSIPTGLAWDGTNLWNADLNNEKIYKLDATGTVLSAFATPGQYPTGLAWHGSGFWLCDTDVPTLWKLNASGGVLSSFSATGTFHYGLAWDGQNLWLADSETLLIYKMDPAGNVLDYYLAPGTNSSGLAWDGANLWAADRNTDLIYKLQVTPTQRFAKDLGATALQLPVSVDLGNSIPIKLVVRNFGTDEQSNFAVGYRINNGPAVAENFSSPLPAGASATHTFAMPWMPAAVGTYRFTAWTALAGDENAQNDTLPTPSQVTVRFAKDLGVTALQLPATVVAGSATPVQAVIQNFGTTSQNNFPVSYRINNGPVVTENFAGPLAASANATKTFTTSWTPATAGTYRFTAWTVLAGEENTANDTLPTPKEVSVTAPLVAGSLHVSTTGNDANSGASATPLRNIQTALNRAGQDDTVKVAGGVYVENLTAAKKVALRGGYSSAFAESARDIFNNKTIIRPPASGICFTDAQSSTIDGFVLDGGSGASIGILVKSGHTIISHNVIHNFYQGFARGIEVQSRGSATIKNNTITGLRSAGTVIAYALVIDGNTDGLGVIENNIVTNNDEGMDIDPSGIRLDYNCSFGNRYLNYRGSNGKPGAHDVTAAPQFLNAAIGDYRLKPSSPCVNAGNPADPLGDEPEPNGGRIDIGAYGGTKNATRFITAPILSSPTNAATGQPLKLTLSWNPSVAAISYRLQVATSAAFTKTVFDDSSLTITSREIGSLESNTTYYWRVKAKRDSLASAWSSPVWNFTTILTPPRVPTLFSPLDRAASQPLTLTLRWNAVAGAAAYRLQISTSAIFATTTFDDSTITEVEKKVGPLTQNSTYYWRVKAKNNLGTSEYSTVWSFTTWIPFTSQARWRTDGVQVTYANEPVPGDPTGEYNRYRFSPHLVSDGAGGAIIAWQDDRTASRIDNIYAQRVDGNGKSFWQGNGAPICTEGNEQTEPRLVSDGAGGAIVIWHDGRNNPNQFPNTYDIYAQRVNSNGQALWTLDGVRIGTATARFTPHQVVSDGAGGAIIVWERSGNTRDIFAQRVDGNGNVLWQANGVAICTLDGHQDDPVMASDGAGGAIIAWSDGQRSGIYAQRVDGNGYTLWPMNGIAIYKGDDRTPYMVSDGAGGAIMVWGENRATAYDDIFAQRVNGKGELLWPEKGAAICTEPENQTDLKLLSDGSGGAIIAWTDYRNYRSSSYTDIFAQRVDGNGNIFWSPTGVAISAKAYGPDLVSDGHGGAIVIWGYQPGVNQHDIYAQRFDANGNVFWQNNGIAICTARGIQREYQLTSDGGGGAIITWRDGRSVYSNIDIYAQRVNDLATAVSERKEASLPSEFMLNQNYPNPFNPSTTISFALPRASYVTLKVFNLKGEEVANLVSKQLPAGRHQTQWNAGGFASGVYFYRLQADDFFETQKLILLR